MYGTSTSLLLWAVLVPLIWYLLQAIADWRILSKAGRPGWFSLIPVVNVVSEYSICWSAGMGVLYMLCTFAVSSLKGVENPSSMQTTIASAAGVLAGLLHLVQSFKLAKSYGKGFFTGVLLVLFGPLARVFFGLGDSRYIGKP